MGWISRILLGVDPNKAVDHVANGLGAIGTMIDERKFTAEEESKASFLLVEKGLEFQGANLEQNSERSKARRKIAEKWVGYYLDILIPTYLISVLINIWYPVIQSLVTALHDIIILMGTGTLMVLGFFFGTHLVRTGVKIAKGK